MATARKNHATISKAANAGRYVSFLYHKPDGSAPARRYLNARRIDDEFVHGDDFPDGFVEGAKTKRYRYDRMTQVKALPRSWVPASRQKPQNVKEKRVDGDLVTEVRQTAHDRKIGRVARVTMRKRRSVPWRWIFGD